MREVQKLQMEFGEIPIAEIPLNPRARSLKNV